MTKANGTRATDDEAVESEGGTNGPAGADDGTHSAIDGVSQAAGAAAQRAGVVAQRAGAVVTDVAGDVASTVSAHAPAVIDASKTTVGVAAREVRAASSRDLMLGTVFSTGLASGLLLARGPRLLVLMALAPVFALGGTLLSRRGGGPTVSSKPATVSQKKSTSR